MQGVEGLMRSPARKKLKERLEFDNKENEEPGKGSSSASGGGPAASEQWLVQALHTSLGSFAEAVQKQFSVQQQQVDQLTVVV
eukprot:2230470-Karenia_brevis.AAC.1